MMGCGISVKMPDCMIYVNVSASDIALAQRLPIIPGSIVTLRNTSHEVYEPHALRRSRYAADGPDAFILVDSSALQLLSNPIGNDIYTVTLLAGHPIIEEYVDGPAIDAR